MKNWIWWVAGAVAVLAILYIRQSGGVKTGPVLAIAPNTSTVSDYNASADSAAGALGSQGQQLASVQAYFHQPNGTVSTVGAYPWAP